MSVDVLGNDPLVDGMHIAVRIRLDFVVTDAARLMAAAREAYREVNPDAAEDDSEAAVTCAADAIFAVLERDGVFGAPADRALGRRTNDGLSRGGSVAKATFGDPRPLPTGGCLFGYPEDLFALPASHPSGRGDQG